MLNGQIRIIPLLLLALTTTRAITLSRRHLLRTSPAVFFLTRQKAHASTDAELLSNLSLAKAELMMLPKSVENKEWDPVRVKLRSPAIAALWNVADSSNTLRKLALSRGDPDIIEAADEIARALRDVDQIVYSNSFSMEGKMAGAGLRTTDGAVGRAGEGGGKYRVAEPQALLRSAAQRLEAVIDGE